MSGISNLKFKTAVARAFPDRSSARAARFASVNQRTMQKWLAGEADVPVEIAKLFAMQAVVVEEMELREHLDALAKEFLDRDGHPESLGSILSALYQCILDRPIA